MSDYIELGDLINSISKTHKFEKEKLIFLNTSDVLKGKILVNHYTYVKDLKGQAKKTIQNGDILYSEIRPKNQRYAYVKNIKNTEDYVVSTKLMVLRNETDVLDTDYLYHFLTYKETLNYLQRKAENRIGSFPQITFNVLKQLKIWLPNLNTQKSIAKVLSDLDAKIEINNKINQELEAMAKMLYDYWFVQFDFPNKEGKSYKSSGGQLVFNKELKREIPEEWEVKALSEVSELKAGGDKPKGYTKGKTTENNIPIYSNGVTNEGLYGYTDFAKISKESITISARGTIGYCVLRKKPFVPIIRLISVTPNYSDEIKYLFETIKNLVFENSGSVQQQLTVPQISKLIVLYPTKSLLNKYDSLTKHSLDKIEINKQQNQQLTELRDWLLPMLMNGQVTVGEATLRQAQDDKLGMVAEDGIKYGKETELKMVVVKPFHRSSAVIGTHIVKKLENSPGMGRVKFQKVLHLTEFYCNTELGGLYYQKAAGPHNDILIQHIEGKFRNYGHVTISNDFVNGNKHFIYKTTPKTKESETAYQNLTIDFKIKLDNLIGVLEPLNLKETEAISTLYAVWNNRIIENKEINNQALINDFYNWSDRKSLTFSDSDIIKALDSMKLQSIIPTGWGSYIGKKEN